MPCWTLIEEQQLVKLNFDTKANPQEIKVNSLLTKEKTEKLHMLFKKFKDVFSWTYKNLKGIPPTLVQHIIELDTSIPVAHQTRYKLNPNYVAIVKQDINNLLVVGFIQLVKKVTWLSPIVVIFKKNRKLTICVDDMSSNSSRDPKVAPGLK
jgi:hypothetical protein